MLLGLKDRANMDPKDRYRWRTGCLRKLSFTENTFDICGKSANAQFAGLSRISKVFLPNWQQDLQMLNLAKLSFSWDTLYEKVSDVVESRIRFIHHFIHHTYSKIWINLDWVFWLLFGDFWGREKDYIASLTIFKIWVFSATFLHEITLYAMDIDKERFRTPFLTL